MTTLLLVDDDADLRLVLGVALSDYGYRVVASGDAESALYEFSAHAVDAVLVDIRLPGMSGLELCREIRRRGTTPLVAMTGLGLGDDIDAGFEAGADDYVIKPVRATDLAQRIEATLTRHRSRAATPARLTAGDLVLDLPDGPVRWLGESIPVSGVEARLLAVLAEHPGMVRRREELLERVWGTDGFDDLALVDRQLQRLGARLTRGTHSPVIQPDAGSGYRLVL
ncbi:MAG: response regulator transcription factor [Actinomycetota bacterium]